MATTVLERRARRKRRFLAAYLRPAVVLRLNLRGILTNEKKNIISLKGMSKKSPQKFRNVCFTSFEAEMPAFLPQMSYLVCGAEICPKTKAPHWQCYAEFKSQVRFEQLKKLLGETTHLEARRGSAESASLYCQKDGKFQEFGEISSQGKRSDLATVIDSIEDNYSVDAIAMENPATFIKYSRGIKELVAIRNKAAVPKWRQVEVIVLIGPTGCGKTRRAHQEDDIYDVICERGKPLWFDGYESQTSLLLDEFMPEAINFQFLLRLLDGYEMRLPIKGGFAYANWTKVFITSNIPLERWYPGVELSPLKRRVTTLVDQWEVASEVRASQVEGNTIPPLASEVVNSDGDEIIGKPRGNYKRKLRQLLDSDSDNGNNTRYSPVGDY